MEKNTVIITGASRGIGHAAALKFAQNGYNIIMTCKNNIDSLTDYADHLSSTYGISCTAFKCDGSDTDSVNEFFIKIQSQLDDVDILINNAGISIVGLIQDMTYDEWNHIVSCNMSAAFYMCKNIIPSMLKKKSGKIINISSVWGNAGASCEVAYSTTKGGLNSFTKALAKELAPSGISVNAIAFGAINTDMNSFLSIEEKAELESEIPFGRMASPEEAASYIYNLSQSPDYLTGQIISFDGGWI